MAEYRTLLAGHNATKASIANAESLFGLPITSYPPLSNASVEMDKLEKIYGLYAKFTDFRDEMSNTLWADLDKGALDRGAEALVKLSRKFDRALVDHSVYKETNGTIVNFQGSLPLIIQLKNDAMMPRHWKRLMESTGVTFDLNPKTLTLQNIFSMELHQFIETVDEIVNEAVQELKIEVELTKVENQWAAVSLDLAKYSGKGGEDRGYTLLPADALRLELDDTLLNLGTIAGSRFIGEFAGQARHWDKSLNLMGDTLTAWFETQTKWMYV